MERSKWEDKAILDTAAAMCAAARTAPKACGVDHLIVSVMTGDELETLARAMEDFGNKKGLAFFDRDAGNVRASGAVVFLATAKGVRKLGKPCSYCGFDGCSGCAAADGFCAFDTMDLGIAIGSAVSVAADRRIDNRILFSAGNAAMAAGLLPPEARQAVGIPLAVGGKSPFFDRK